jgi:formylglycine-generating enzyme required for sulfatase activity
MACARRLGLVVPTEAQWEYAARGGTDLRWGTTSEISALAAIANLRDATCKRHDYMYDQEEFDDGWLLHAPVGSLRPNQFGLHDMIGNVSEWVREPPTDYNNPVRPGDGEREHDAAESARLVRGGSFEGRASHARVAFRLTMAAGPNATVGVRFARDLRP